MPLLKDIMAMIGPLSKKVEIYEFMNSKKNIELLEALDKNSLLNFVKRTEEKNLTYYK